MFVLNRYGLADPIFQPVLKDPMYLKMKSGNTTKKAFARVLETTQVSTDHLPGIFVYSSRGLCERGRKGNITGVQLKGEISVVNSKA